MSPSVNYKTGGVWVEGGGPDYARIGGIWESLRVQPPSTINVLRLDGTLGNHASTPDTVANSLSAALDIRVKVSFADWLTLGAGVPLLAKWTSTNQRSYKLQVRTNAGSARLSLLLTDGGSTIKTQVEANLVGLVTNGQPKWLRVTWLDSSNAVTYYTSDDGSAWTQLLAGSISSVGIHNGTGPVTVGGDDTATMNGDLYYAEVRSSIDGTVVHSFDATAVTKLGTRDPSTVAAGGPWTINGSTWDWAGVAV